jgi:type I restriction-modification system DNA methylase subunit
MKKPKLKDGKEQLKSYCNATGAPIGVWTVCVASLQDVKLFNSNLEVVDEAFEYLINKRSKGEKGQCFTPRYVIDMCDILMATA